MKGVNVTMRYVELASGKIIDGNRAANIRQYAWSTWVFMAKSGAPPATWGSADLKSREMYCREMTRTFEELGFCELDWKSKQIATDNYPSWRSTWAKQNQGKNQDVKPSVSESNPTTQVKRIRCESTKLDPKRKKLASAQDHGDLVIGDMAIDLTENTFGLIAPEDAQVGRF
jgi:hypothetical protein